VCELDGPRMTGPRTVLRMLIGADTLFPEPLSMRS